MLSALFVLGAFFLSSCEPEESKVGLGIHPKNDQVNLFTTSMINYAFQTRSEDSVITNNTSQNIVGSFYDPVFGVSRADLAFQLRLPANDIQIDNRAGIVVDSVILFLIAPTSYGPEKRSMAVEVYELAEEMMDTTYYSSYTFATEPDNLMADPLSSISVDLDQTYVFGEDSITGVIAIPIAKSWGEKILDFQGTSEFETNENFLKTIKGLLVKEPSTNMAMGDGSLYMVNLFNIYSKLEIRYTDTTQTEPVQQTLDLNITSESNKVHTVKHDHDLGTISLAIDDTINDQSNVFIQSLGGLKATLDFKNLLALADSFDVLNKVELVLPVDEFPGDTLGSSFRLVLEINEGDSTSSFTPDLTEGDAHIGGYLNDQCGCYVFTITRFFQGVLNGDIASKKLNIVPSGESIRAQRTILKGKNHPSGGPQLYIYGTKF